MPNTKYLDELAVPAINDEVWGFCHDPLAGAADVTQPAQFGVGKELRSGVPNALRRFLGGCGIIPGDVLLCFDKVRQRRTRPA